MTDHTSFTDENIQDMNTNQLTAIRIKEERTRLNYSQQAVADHLKMDISNYSRLENGKIEITIAKLEAIAEFLRVPIVTLIPNINANQYNINHGTALVNNNNGNLTQIIDLENFERSLRTILSNIENINKSI